MNNELEIKISSNIEEANKKLDDLIRLLNSTSSASDNYNKSLKRMETGLNEISNVLTKTNRMSNFVMVLNKAISCAEILSNISLTEFNNQLDKLLEKEYSIYSKFRALDLADKINLGTSNQKVGFIDDINKATLSAKRLETIDLSLFENQLTGLISTLQIASESLNKIDGNKISKVLSSIPRSINNINKIDLRKTYGTFSSLTRIIEPFLKKLEQSKESMLAFVSICKSLEKGANSVNKITYAYNNLNKKINNTSKSTSLFMKMMNFTTLIHYARRFWNIMFEGIDTINQYTENLNLFHIVMGDLVKQADKFQNIMSESFGNNTSTQLYYQSMYQSLTESMGLQEEYAYIISENMTKMVYDISSLFDQSQDTVASALRAGLVGQTKPVRNYGLDITENSLQPILDRLEINRTVRELSQAEKQILRYIALLDQSSVAHGDMANTIESPANQLRVFKNQLVECARWLGAVFIGKFAEIMPYINAFVMVIKEVTKSIAYLFGFELNDYNSGIASYEGMYEDLGDTIDDTTDKVKELKRQTLGFDQINNINENKDKDDGNISGGIDQRLLDAITGYDNGMDKVRMKATEIRDRLMEWLGFTKEVNDETGEIYFKLKDGYTNLEKLRDILIVVGGLWGVSKVLKFGEEIVNLGTGLSKTIPSIKNFFLAFSSLFTGASSISLAGTKFAGLSSILATLNTKFTLFATSLGLSVGTLAIVITSIVALVGVLIHAYNNCDTFREKVNVLVKNILDGILNVYNCMVNVTESLLEILNPIWSFIKDTSILILGSLYDSVVLVFSNIVDTINGTIEIIDLILNGDFKGAFESANNTINKFKDNWNIYFEEIGNKFNDWKEKTINNAKDFVDKVNKKIEEIELFIKELPNKFFYWFGKAVGTAYKVITETDWKKIGLDILTKIINGICDFGEKISQWRYNFELKVKNAILNTNWKEIGKNVLDGIIKGMTEKINTIKNWGNSFLKGVKDALDIHSPSRKAKPIGIMTFLGIKEGMDEEIPNIENTALNMLDTLKTTFDKGYNELSLDTALSPNLSREFSNISNFKSDSNIDYNMLEQASYNGFAKAIKQYGLVKIDVKQDKGSIVETAIEGINLITKQTGESPIDLW